MVDPYWQKHKGDPVWRQRRREQINRARRLRKEKQPERLVANSPEERLRQIRERIGELQAEHRQIANAIRIVTRYLTT